MVVEIEIGSCEADAIEFCKDHSMLRPTHAKKQFKANRVFSGRQEERDLFLDAFTQTDAKGTYQILNWYGVGGQGKSSLLREFQRLMTAHNETVRENGAGVRLIPAKIDFEDERLKRVDAALYSLRRQLAQSSGFAFLTFDAAFVAYHTKTRPGMDIGSTYPELFKGEKDGMMDLIDVLDDPLTVASHLASAALPGAGLIYKWGSRLTGKLAKWWKTRGNELIAGIEALQPEQILEKLPTFLGIDLCDGIEAKPDRRPVVLLDTYEALWRNRGQKDGLADRRADAWVRLFVQDAPGTLFVIAGRDQLRWSAIDEAWVEVVESHLLGALSDDDAETFLLEVPITEGDVRAKITGSSQGLPFYLDLQVSHYETLKERGEAPTEASFGGTPSDILARFLEHLSDNDQATLSLASYLQVITRETMDKLVSALPDSAINYNFEQMVARSSFAEISEGTFEIHALLKNELQSRESSTRQLKFRDVHGKLHQIYVEAMEDNQGPKYSSAAIFSFDSAFHHLFKADPMSAVKWLLEENFYLYMRSAWGEYEKLHRISLEYCRHQGASHTETELSLRNNLAVCLQEQGDSIAAEAEFKKLLKDLETTSLEGRFFASRIHLNLGLMHYVRGETSHSEEYLGLATQRLLKGGKALGWLPVLGLSAMADLRLKAGDHKSAETLLLKAAQAALHLHSYNNYALVMELFGEVFDARRDIPQAASCLYFSTEIRRESEPSHAPTTEREISGDNASNVRELAVMEVFPFPDRYWETTTFNAFERLLLPPWSNAVAADSRQKTGTNQSGSSSLRSRMETIWKATKPELPRAMERHPNESELMVAAIDMLNSTSVGALLLRVGEKHEVDIQIYSAERFDFGYFRKSRTLWMTLGAHCKRLPAEHILGLLYQLRTIDHELMGFGSPPMSEGVHEFAISWHGRCLDRVIYLMRFILELPEAERLHFREALTEPARNLLAGVEKKLSKERLFDLYVPLISSWDHWQES